MKKEEVVSATMTLTVNVSKIVKEDSIHLVTFKIKIARA
jgi:hypothetical protein